MKKEEEMKKKNEGDLQRHDHRILIVDDEEDVTFFLKEALESYGGFEVVTFNDPLLALSSFNNKAGVTAYDLILLDIKMPTMDGFELYQELQKKIEDAHDDNGNNSKKTKICFMTAFEVYYEALKELFPDSYSSVCFIKKPASAEDLVKRITKEIG
jgi:CheY-like chemotaxis protein